MIPVIFSPRADADLEEIGDSIALNSPAAAKKVVAQLRIRALKIGYMPRAYPPRGDLSPGLRAMNWRPYIVFFRVTRTQVEVARIVHGARDLNRLFES